MGGCLSQLSKRNYLTVGMKLNKHYGLLKSLNNKIKETSAILRNVYYPTLPCLGIPQGFIILLHHQKACVMLRDSAFLPAFRMNLKLRGNLSSARCTSLN